MLIEFFGLPGAGKSTLSHHVSSLLSKRGYAVDEVTYKLDHDLGRLGHAVVKLASITRHIGRRPARVLLDVAHILVTQQNRWADAQRSVFNWLYITSVMARRSRDDRILILDQGLAQAIWTVGLAARQRSWLDICRNAARDETLRPDLIVEVKARFQNVSARLASRQRRISRIDSLGNSFSVLRRSQDNADAIILTFKESGVLVLEIENDSLDQLESGAQLLADTIAAMSDNKRGDPNGHGLWQVRITSSKETGDGKVAKSNLLQSGNHS
ncbi:hypothetical protein [Microvirga sp. G4-2]|uniref:hypothetical protein n=1 Tax=Microvirga sp. G4-2 TaxID=3434467 RepID=UPI0040444E57